MSRKCGLAIVIIILCLIVFLPFFCPRNLVKDLDDFTIHRIEYNGEDITSEMDLNVLRTDIQKTKIKRAVGTMNSYEKESYALEIDAVNAGSPLHILLGNNYICYESTGSPVWKIIEGDVLFNKIVYRYRKRLFE